MTSPRAPLTDSHLPRAVVHLAGPGPVGWYEALGFERAVTAERISAVRPALDEVERATQLGRLHALGFVSYEAAPAFDDALVSREPGPVPLVWFGLFRELTPIENPVEGSGADLADGTWVADTERSEYLAQVDAIRDRIALGDTYQVNATLRLRGHLEADPWTAFQRLIAAQPVPHATFLDTGRFAICCASPELYLRLDGDAVSSRPMKGTRPRGRWAEEDDALRDELADSKKDRAENLMIVDMVRNDLGRVAEPGSVEVQSLFEIERYRTVWQMTSLVTARTGASWPDVLGATFPCASITGAPKSSSMGIIAELERSPRGVYTGAVGWIGPGRRAELSVAIRTLVVDRETGDAEYGTGSGIVWDSVAAAEYDECLTKARVVMGAPSTGDPSLLETMLWRPGVGLWLEAEHLARLRRSAAYFELEVPTDLAERLHTAVRGLPPVDHRVRLILGPGGSVEVAAMPLEPIGDGRRWRLAKVGVTVDSREPLLFHKTTHREIYDRASQRALAAGADDAVLVNERGEVTETTIGNLIVRLGDRLVTPAIGCGLLPGILRAELLRMGTIEEGVLSWADLERADEVWMVNSVRGRVPAVLVRADPPPSTVPSAG